MSVPMSPAADQSSRKSVGPPVAGRPLAIGDGFSAKHFSEEMFEGRMDPLLMVDHFVMTTPTFDPHPHAGISAVTVVFEDAEGSFLNRDSLGNHIAIRPGDLYWLAAASGAVHEEKPQAGARTHALQIFVNLPGRLKFAAARAIHVRAEDVPSLVSELYRVRVLLGRSGTVAGAGGTPEDMTMLDGFLTAGGSFTHQLAPDQHVWVYAVSGQVTLRFEGTVYTLDAGSATTISTGQAAPLALESPWASHFFLMAAKPIRERFVKHGPLVMSTAQDVRRALEDYAAGRFGELPDSV